ncbi:hypothetical protein SKAU_G00302630, partial [Synaphobranchus kaupii]
GCSSPAWRPSCCGLPGWASIFTATRRWATPPTGTSRCWPWRWSPRAGCCCSSTLSLRPTSHCAPPPSPSAPDYFDTSQAPPRMRETSFDEDVPLSHRQFVENQSYAFDEHSAGLRAGGNGSSGTGPRPSAPFQEQRLSAH